ncbi:MAG TPA: family 10 glycosylhydrolase [Vicinamibacterales bacterium]|nr:family 10 glycosylhydrolase [Vicinamibacterales bacterium]
MRLSIAPTTLRRGLTVFAAVVLLGFPATAFVPSLNAVGPSPASTAASETRALWVLRSSLSTRESIMALVRTAREHGFNTLLVQIRGRGDAYYSSTLEPRAAELHRQAVTFDPLASVLDAAHAAGLRVHAWMNINLVSSAVDLPIAPTHLVHRHPEWLMVPRDLAQELVRVKENSPAYVGRLARWTRAQPAGVEGLYASPIVPGAAAHVEAVVQDVITRYPLDGIHLDYARYPGERFDYSQSAIREFRATIRPTLSAAARREADAREAIDPLIYPDTYPEEWKTFRLGRMTALVGRLQKAIKSARPTAFVSVATAPDLREAREHRLQDWATWLTAGLVDAVCPMAYTPEPAKFAEQIAAAREVAGTRAIWAGIGAYRIPPAQTIENIATARRLGASGVVLFSYDSLIDPAQSTPDYIAVVGRSAFATPAASSDGTR